MSDYALYALIIVAAILATLVSLGAIAGTTYVMWSFVNRMREWSLVRQRRCKALSLQVADEDRVLRQRLTQIQRERIDADRAMAESKAHLKRFLLAIEAEQDAMRKDATAKAKGVLSSLAEAMAAEQQERVHLQERLDAAQVRSQTLESELHLARERSSRLEAERDGVLAQNADLRAMLSSIESKAHVNASLMTIGKLQDDSTQDIQALRRMVEAIAARLPG
jgi:hypothetical protein